MILKREKKKVLGGGTNIRESDKPITDSIRSEALYGENADAASRGAAIAPRKRSRTLEEGKVQSSGKEGGRPSKRGCANSN